MCPLVASIRKILETGPVCKSRLLSILNITKDYLPNLKHSLQSLNVCPGRYLLYKDPDYGFVIMMLVWAPGDSTPIHAHGTWGVEAVIKRSVRITTFSACPNQPIPIDSQDFPEGSLAYVMPPDEDVHTVSNTGVDHAVTVHIYGQELTENIVFTPGHGFNRKPVVSLTLDHDPLTFVSSNAFQVRV